MDNLARDAGWDVLIVFVDHGQCRWLKWLRPGFRHCFAAIRFEEQWVICELLKDKMEVQLIDWTCHFDLAKFYVDQGHTVISGTRTDTRSNIRIFADVLTCVAVTKRLVGLRCFWIWTPWQLFRFLTSARGAGPRWRLLSAPPAGSAGASSLTG